MNMFDEHTPLLIVSEGGTFHRRKCDTIRILFIVQLGYLCHNVVLMVCFCSFIWVMFLFEFERKFQFSTCMRKKSNTVKLSLSRPVLVQDTSSMTAAYTVIEKEKKQIWTRNIVQQTKSL